MGQITVTYQEEQANYSDAGLYLCMAYSSIRTVFPVAIEFEVTVKGERCIATKSLTWESLKLFKFLSIQKRFKFLSNSCLLWGESFDFQPALH